jgi:hypothetical protein
VGGIGFIVEGLYGGGIGDKPAKKRMPASSSGKSSRLAHWAIFDVTDADT